MVGPTATGKTALGVALAEQFGGEVISADSMQIYKGLDVGTAKVTPEETHGIPHHGVDILEPDAPFSVADFTAMAGRLEQEVADPWYTDDFDATWRDVTEGCAALLEE